MTEHGSTVEEPLELEDDYLDRQAAETDPRIASAKSVLSAFKKAARANQLYPKNSRVRKDVYEEFGETLLQHVTDHDESRFVLKQDHFLYLDQVIHQDESKHQALSFGLFLNGVRGITFYPGVTHEEAVGLIEILTSSFDKNSTTDDLRTLIWEQCFTHIRFHVIDDLFSEEEEQEFQVFMDTSAAEPGSAQAARLESQVHYDELLEFEPLAGEREGAPFHLPPLDLEALQREGVAESERELLVELSEFLVAALQEDEAEAVQGHLEDLLEHMLAAGEILRAAQLLSGLQRVARQSGNDVTQQILSDALRRVGETKVIPHLRPLIPTLAGEEREALVTLLLALGEPAIAPLCDLLDSAAKDSALQALRTLSKQFPHALLAFAQHPQLEVARNVVMLLGESGDTSVASGLMPAVRHPDTGVRREALKALKALGAFRVIELFLTALDDPSYEVRAMALEALGASKNVRAGRELLQRVDDGKFLGFSEFEKKAYFRALGEIRSPEIIIKLVELLGKKAFLRRAQNNDRRALAALALGLVATPAAKGALERHKDDKAEVVRRAVRHSLVRLESVDATAG